MQQLRSRRRWYQTVHRFGMSTFLALSLVLFAFTNATMFLLAQIPQNVHAQIVPTSAQSTDTPQKPDTTQAVASNPTPQPVTPQSAPTRTPAPVRASTPAPASDTISIPSVGLSSQFVSVGLTSTNAVDVSPTLAGWFDHSSQPGTIGAAFFDGHNPGVFRKLPSVHVGAKITVARASGEVFNYTVVHIDTVMLVDVEMSDVLQPYGHASEGLNLMTCVGTYNNATGTTDQRLIVYAVRS